MTFKDAKVDLWQPMGSQQIRLILTQNSTEMPAMGLLKDFDSQNTYYHHHHYNYYYSDLHHRSYYYQIEFVGV